MTSTQLLRSRPPTPNSTSMSSAEKIEVGLGFLLLATAVVIYEVRYVSDGFPGIQSTLGNLIVWGVGLVGNFLLLRRLPTKWATTAVWLELLAGFLAFCSLFDIQFAYVFSKSGPLLGYELRDGFVQGAALTIAICATAIVLAVLIALIAALAKLFGDGIAIGLATFYISFFRGTPLLLQILIIYLGLPQIGWVIAAIPAGILALSLNYGAYMAEIFRSGIEAINRGQWEASDALGFSRSQSLRKIILPQSMRLIVPATGNQFIMMLKDSSLVSIMGVWELMYVGRAIGRADFKYMEMLIASAVVYWFLSAILEIIQTRIERHYARTVRR